MLAIKPYDGAKVWEQAAKSTGRDDGEELPRHADLGGRTKGSGRRQPIADLPLSDPSLARAHDLRQSR